MNSVEIKKTLIYACKKSIESRIMLLQRSMNEAQSSANAHKGAMESRYDTFKEEAQYLAGGYAKQIHEAKKILLVVNNIPVSTETNVMLGAVVITTEEDERDNRSTKKRYFISSSIDDNPIVVDGNEYICLSANAPVATVLMNKEAGDVVKFRSKLIEITELF